MEEYLDTDTNSRYGVRLKLFFVAMCVMLAIGGIERDANMPFLGALWPIPYRHLWEKSPF